MAEEPLDNPIWGALTSVHAPLAMRRERAAKYPADVSPLAGLETSEPEAFSDLAALTPHGEQVAFFTREPIAVPVGWAPIHERWIDQMVCAAPPTAIGQPFLELSPADGADMLALASATAPGPFLSGTPRMGRYIGLRDGEGRLVAMAGERLRLERFTEISAVCTAPEARGQGYAAALVVAMSRAIFAAGRTPFLHVKTENGARRVYERLGFQVRRAIRLTVVTPATEGGQAA
ncbi:MAG TPA: GNAT family N-acetyltransferase [Caulobacteraceae bacterium]|nr:GNAT family N-acetyltransferase [Caulobacteraceae bacterium]